MNEERPGWAKLGALGAFLAGIAAVATFYYTFINPRPQTFTVPIKPSAQQSGVLTGVFTHERGLQFEVKRCSVSSKVVFCVLTVVSPAYDRTFYLQPYQSFLLDADGDRFTMSDRFEILHLDRDQPITFRMTFPVNKDIARPAHVQMVGAIDGSYFEKGFEVK
jgi:hypothetical protein